MAIFAMFPVDDRITIVRSFAEILIFPRLSRFLLMAPCMKGNVMSARATWFRAGWIALVLVLVVALPSFAQASPWETSVGRLMTSFTGPIARGMGLIAIVIGGLAFAFGEHGAKQLLAGVLFGVGMAIGAVNFMAWLFP
jgi:type IV secretory pathway VirB2 component (pilin)